MEIPAAAREKSDKGAEAFVRYFFDQVNLAWTEPTPGLIPLHSDRGCKSCASLEETAGKLKTNGQRYNAEPIAVRSVTAVKGAPSGQTYVEARLLQNQAHVIDSKGAIVSTDKMSPFDRTVSVVWQGDRWLVYAIA